MKPITNAWALREVYFDENGEPGMHREPEQAQPVAWMWKDGTITADPDRADGTWTPLYTSPPPRQPLTDEEISKVAAPFYGVQGFRVEAFARAIEAKIRGGA